MKTSNKTILLILIIFGFIFIAVGATFAYFTASTNTGHISGSTYDFNIAMTITPKKTGNLIPTASTLIDTTMESVNKCVDSNNNNICAYYEVKLNNSGSAQILNAYVITGNISNKYTTDHLHFKLFDSSYEALSDEINLSYTVGDKNNIKDISSNNNLSITVPNGESTYYIVLWLYDVNDDQPEDINKKFAGSLQFETTTGDKIFADFES